MAGKRRARQKRCIDSPRHGRLESLPIAYASLGSGSNRNPRDTIGNKRRVADFNRDGKPDLAISMAFGTTEVAVLLGNGDGAFTFHDVPVPALDSGGMDAADVTGDGVPDLVIASHLSPSVSVLPGLGDGHFGPAQTFAAGAAALVDVVAADVNRDGTLDLVASSQYDGVVTHLGLGNGAFGPPVPSTTPPLLPIAVADLDRDELPDLVALDMESGFIAAGLGSGDGRFGATVPGFQPITLAAGDLDGDGLADLVVQTDYPSPAFRGIMSRGGRHHDVMPGVPLPSLAYSIRLADVDEDGHPDALVPVGSAIAVLKGNGDGTFAVPVYWPLGASAADLTGRDVDGDGHLDLVTTSGPGFQVLLGRGDGTFGGPIASAVPAGAGGLAIGDIDGDTHPDVAATWSSRGPFWTNYGLELYTGRGDGSFPFWSYLYQEQEQPAWLGLRDPGRDDLVITASRGSCLHCGYVRVWPISGAGIVGAPIDSPVGPFGGRAQFPDLDHDATPDLLLWDVKVALGDGAGRFSLEKRLCLPPRPGRTVCDHRLGTREHWGVRLDGDARALGQRHVQGRGPLHGPEPRSGTRAALHRVRHPSFGPRRGDALRPARTSGREYPGRGAPSRSRRRRLEHVHRVAPTSPRAST